MAERTSKSATRDDDAFIALALRHLAGELSADEAAEFSKLVESEERRAQLVDITIHARLLSTRLRGQLLGLIEDRDLLSEAMDESAADGALSARSTPVLGFLGKINARLGQSVAWTVAIVGALLAGYFITISWGIRSQRESSGGASSATIAMIRETTETKWSIGSRFNDAKNRSDAIKAGESIDIESGVVEVQLKQGVTLFVQGPSSLTADGANSATLKRGKLVAKVPREAIGFSIITPTARIVDLGTEFGVEVDERGATDVIVIKGLVETMPIGAPADGSDVQKTVRLGAGEGVRISNGEMKPTPVEPKRFAFDPKNQPALEVKDFSPDKIEGMRLWLRADQGVVADAEGRVVRWEDQSGRGYHAQQGAEANQPKLLAANNEGDVPAIQFDGVDDYLPCATGLDLDASGVLSIFIAVKGFGDEVRHAGIFTIIPSEGADWNQLDGLAIGQWPTRGKLSVGVVQASNEIWNAQGSDELRALTLVENKPMVINLTKRNGVASIQINGRTAIFDSYNFTPAGDHPKESKSGYLLGARFDRGNQRSVGYFGSCQISEVLVYDHALSGQEINLVNAYLVDRNVKTKN